MTLNGGTIQDAAGNAAVLTLPAIGTDGLAGQDITITTLPLTVIDVLWQNPSTGSVGMWLVQNSQNAQNPQNAKWTSLSPPSGWSSSAWTAVGEGDFAGDGNTDMLWQNNTSGDVYMWRIQNAQTTGWVFLGHVPDRNWTVAGVGDFDGDGKADILWYHQSTGLTGAWLSSQSTTSGLADSTGWTPLGHADPSAWTVAGVGDFDGDGHADVLWYDKSTGLVGTWLSSISTATTVLVGSPIQLAADDGGWVRMGQEDPSVLWKVGVGDFDGDGRADVLGHDQSTGSVVAWLSSKSTTMVPGTTTSLAAESGQTSLGQADPSAWTVAGVEDFNGDGYADVLWHDQSTGLTGTWLSSKSTSTLAMPAAWTPLGGTDLTTVENHRCPGGANWHAFAGGQCRDCSGQWQRIP